MLKKNICKSNNLQSRILISKLINYCLIKSNKKYEVLSTNKWLRFNDECYGVLVFQFPKPNVNTY